MIEVVAHLLWDGALWAGAVMFSVWLIHLWTGNASIAGVGWAGGLVLLSVLYGFDAGGHGPRKWLLASMVSLWGLRLAGHLLVTRVIGKPEEGRCLALRRKWKTYLALRFFVLFEFQALVCVVLSLALAIPALNPAPSLQPLEYLGAGLWLIAFAGEAVADAQLQRFRRDPANQGKLCASGLWNYSRHPNYFFEWLIWVAFAVFALASPGGWAALVAPALMLYWLLRASGIPATEAQAIRGRGDAYREYQRTTSRFIPWFKRA